MAASRVDPSSKRNLQGVQARGQITPDAALASVTQDGQRFGVLWLIGDVDFSGVDRESVGDITLLRPTNPPEFLVSRLLPGALWAHDHGYPMPGAKHTGLMWASGKGDGHHWDVTTPINNGMGRFMHAIRLATAATTIERMVWLGEPSMIHVEGQSAWPQVEENLDTWWRRVGTITPDRLPGLRRLTSMIERLEVPSEAKKKKGALSAIVIAPRSLHNLSGVLVQRLTPRLERPTAP